MSASTAHAGDADPSKVARYLRGAEVQLIRGSYQGCCLVCCQVAEACLMHVLKRAPGRENVLGKLIGVVRTEHADLLPEDLTVELNWLQNQRKHHAHYTGEFLESDEAEAERALKLAQRLASYVGLVDPSTLMSLHSEAQREIVGRPAELLLTLDRDEQSNRLHKLLGRAHPVMVYVADGEQEQGHGYFADRAGWQARRSLHGVWRTCSLNWPPMRSAGTGVRLGALIENLAGALELELPLPFESDPMSQPDAWAAPIAKLSKHIRQQRRRLFIRHVIRRPVADDATLVREYLRRLWIGIAANGAETMTLLAFETVRAIREGIPWLSASWRASRRDRVAMRRFCSAVEETSEGTLDAERLAELTSLSQEDLEEWFRKELGRSRTEATNLARELYSTSNRGRFERVAHWIPSLHR